MRSFIGKRCRGLDASGIRRVFDLGATLRNPVDLSIGQPGHDVPDAVKESAVRAIRAGQNRYTPTQGMPALVEALTAHLSRRIDPHGKKLLVTSGVSGGLFLAAAAIIDPGDEIIVPDPYFVMYRQLVTFFGGTPVLIDTYPDFRLTAERIERHITPRAKALIIASPANPTGVVSTESELRELAELAARHGLLVISDEVYAGFSYEGPAASIALFHENTLLLSGFSKSHAAPGWRIGYAFGPAELIAEMGKLQQYSFVCAPAPMQVAILENLDLDTTGVTDAYRRKRDLMCGGLDSRFQLVKPGGAFYLFLKTPWGTDIEFVEEAIRNNLLIIPGSIFSQRNTHFRISYAADDKTLVRGIEILNRMAEKRG